MVGNKCFLYLGVIFACLALLAGCTTIPQPIKLSPVTADVIFPDFSDLVDRVNPSVVAISTESVAYDSLSNPHAEAGSGSGWILDEDGTIVTNNHVIEGARVIDVELYDHRGYTARVVRVDAAMDLAIIKINAGRKLQPLPVADSSKIKVGDWVMIMGNPLGMGISAKQGIISRLGVTMSSSPDLTYYNLIETSAAVNPGNSGGPMVNMSGEVIGITSLKIDAAGVEGMGYAMIIGDIMPVIQVLVKGERAIPPSLGVSLTTVDNGLALLYALPVEQGALVIAISRGGPADAAGIAGGDIIVGFDDKAITNASELTLQIGLAIAGQRVKLTFWHNNEKKAAEAILTAASGFSSPLAKPGAAPRQ